MGKKKTLAQAGWGRAVQFTALVVTIIVIVAWANQNTPDSDWAWCQPVLLSATGVIALLLFFLRTEHLARNEVRRLKTQVATNVEKLNRTQTAIVFGLAKLSESRDTDTGEHLDRVRKYVIILARDLSSIYPELTESTIQKIAIASSLHDIGKVGIPDSILLKPGLLSEGERTIMEYHTSIGGECLKAIQERLGENDFLELACEIAGSHHERWDGAGYPMRLSGHSIPLAARIMSLADVYDALTSKRPYKKARSHEESRRILIEGKGSQFDPDIVDAFLRHENEFEAISVSQKNVADEDCISGLQRLNEAVEALQCSTTNLIGSSLAKAATNSNLIG